jgi:hypothetical protein
LDELRHGSDKFLVFLLYRGNWAQSERSISGQTTPRKRIIEEGKGTISSNLIMGKKYIHKYITT